MNSNASSLVGTVFGKGSVHNLRNVAYRYCEHTWRYGWKKGMEAKLTNPSNPFIGGPQTLIDAGITRLTRPNGSVIEVNKLTRIRLQDLDDNSLAQVTQTIGTKNLIAIKAADPKSNADIVHQEFVATFAENVANAEKHLTNNLVSAATVIEYSICFIGALTLDQLAAAIEELVAGKDPALAKQITIAVRSSWIGRAVQDGSYKTSDDFEFFDTLGHDAASLDPYVAQPVLVQFAKDLRDGFFTK